MIRKTLFALLLSYGLIIKNLSAVNSSVSYDELLQEADRNSQTGRYSQALDKLAQAKEVIGNPDFKYFRILGNTYLGTGYEMEAISQFIESLKLNSNQKDLILRLAELYRKQDHPEEEYKYIRIFLTIKPESLKNEEQSLVYRSLVLAGRIGDDKYISEKLREIEQVNPYAIEKNKILLSVTNMINSHKYKEAISVCNQYLPWFPDDDELYNLNLIALRKIHSEELSSGLVAAAALARDKIKFTLQYAQFLLEEKKKFDALSAYRRAFLLGLKNDKLSDEILISLKQIYYILDKSVDVRAIQAFILLIQTNTSNINALKQIILDYPDNREVLIYYLYLLRHKPEARNEFNRIHELLSRRDDKWEWREFIFGNHAFVKEKLLDKIINTLP